MPTLRRGLPLALTIAVHLLIAALLLARRPPPPVPAGPHSYLLMLVRPAVPPPVRAQAAPSKERGASRARPPARPAPTALRTPAPPQASAVDQPTAAPFVGSLLERARRDVGKIDLELRGGKPVAVGLAADSPRARFESLMASAFIDRSNTMTVDRYQSGDGVVIERVARRGKSTCYMSGTVNFRPGILSDSSVPKTVSCPKGEGWTRQ